jgi:hypothetical protein
VGTDTPAACAIVLIVTRLVPPVTGISPSAWLPEVSAAFPEVLHTVAGSPDPANSR